MKDFFRWLFSQNNSDLKIGLFDGWHFLYLFIIFGGFAFLALFFRNKSERARERVMRIFAYLTIGLYVADFFIMPLSDSYSGISAYKLPFNICTLMAVMVPFVQFNKKLEKIKPTVVILSITSSMMWMCYPGTALGGQPPFSYIIFQTFMYHGLLFNWAALNIALGGVKITIKKCYKELIGILIMFVWALFGNTVYDAGYNWFFIEESIFPFLTNEMMPFMVIFCTFGSSILVYGLYYLISYVVRKIEKRIPDQKKEEITK